MTSCTSQCASSSSLSQDVRAQNSKNSISCAALRQFPALAAHSKAAAAHSAAAAINAAHRHRHYQHYRYSMSDDDSGCVLDEYGWVPPGVTPDIIHSYFAELPEHKVPYVSSEGERWRLEQMERQLPAQDSDPRYCGNLNAAETSELRAFAEARKKHCMGRGQILRLPYVGQKTYCHQCKEPINTNEVAISLSDGLEGGSSAMICWHPKCFVCVECKELLVDLIYFQHNQNVFCGRHHAEQIKPRCAGCDELIFSEECTEAEGRVWHIKHFVCGACGGALGGQRYITCGANSGDRENGALPLCIPCYECDAQLNCNTCRTPVRSDRPHITQGKINWHADAHCFCCCICGENLLGRQYSFANRRLFCGLGATCITTKSVRCTLPQPNFTALNTPNTAAPDCATNAAGQPRRDAHFATFSGDCGANAPLTPAARQKPQPPQRLPRPPSLSPPPPPPSCPVPAVPSSNTVASNTIPSTMVQCYTPPENIYETVMTVSAWRAASKINAPPLLKTFSNISIPVTKARQQSGENSPLRSASVVFSPPFSSPNASSSSSPSAASASSLQRRRLEMEERRRKSRRNDSHIAPFFAPTPSSGVASTITPDQNANYKQYCENLSGCKIQPPTIDTNAGFECCASTIRHNESTVGEQRTATVANETIANSANPSACVRHKQITRCCGDAVTSPDEMTRRRRKHTKRQRSRRRFRSTCSLESVASSCSSAGSSSSSNSSALSYKAATAVATVRRRDYGRVGSAIDYDSATSSGAEVDFLAEYLVHTTLSGTGRNASMARQVKIETQPRARSADGRRRKRHPRRRRSRENKQEAQKAANAPRRADPHFSASICADDAERELALALRQECLPTAKKHYAQDEQMRFQNFYSKMPPENFRSNHGHPRGGSSTRRHRHRQHILRNSEHASLRSGYFSASTTSTSSACSSGAEEEEPDPTRKLIAVGDRFRTQIPLGVDSLKQYYQDNSQQKFKKKQMHYLAKSSQSSQDLEAVGSAFVASPNAVAIDSSK